MKNRFIRYLVLAFAITWLFWWADVLLLHTAGLTVGDAVPKILQALGALGPAAAALCSLDCGFSWIKVKALLLGSRHKQVIHAPQYKAGIREQRPKRPWLWFLGILAGETVLIIVCTEGITRHDPLTAVDFIRWLTLYTFLAGSQELGWRGTLQPMLQKKLPYPLAALLVGLIWGIWQLPLCFMPNLISSVNGGLGSCLSVYLNRGRNGFEPAQLFLIFLLASLMLSFWLGAVYNKTKAVIWSMLLYGWTWALLELVKLRTGYGVYAAAAAFTLICLLIGMTGAKPDTIKIKKES